MTKATETRSIVLELLLEMEKTGQKGHVLVRNVLEKYDYLDARDKAFIKRLADGCMEKQLLLDYLIDQYAVTKKGKMKPVIRMILRMGVYQILFMGSVPDSAACNEAVKLTQAKGLTGLKGFVNGVLRKISREKESLPWPDKDRDRIHFLSAYYSMPEWMIKLWEKDYGDELCEEMLKSFEEPAKTVLHVREDLSKETQEQVITNIKKAGIAIEQHSYLPYAYCIESAEGMERIPGFAEGFLTVQDVSSMLAVELAGMKEGSYVVDVCAAPGGKSIHAAIKTGNSGAVDARDLTEKKVQLIFENQERMQLSNMKIKVFDALKPDEEIFGKADYVIADLPCSGLGVMGRKGDIRYHVTEKTIGQLQKLQRDILKNVKNYLKPGGILVYSTCTVNKEENDNNRQWILDLGCFQPEPFEQRLPEKLKEDALCLASAKEGYLQLYPGRHRCDGFFISCYRYLG